jgi:hypothetical protein
LQVALGEVMTAMMSTHPTMVEPLVNELKTQTLADAFNSGEYRREKFALYLLDDTIEHLGFKYFTKPDRDAFVKILCKYATHRAY